MSTKRTATGPRAEEGTPDANLDRWKRLVGELPDLRIEKVNAARKTLQHNGYEEEPVLEETVRRVCEDVDALYRGQSDSESA